MSAVEYRTGNLFEAEAEVEALVNTVNTQGFMGKGIAAEFKRRFPRDYFEHYETAAKSGRFDIGTVLVWEISEPQLGSPLRYILDFPTKRKWRGRARLEWIEQGLSALRRTIDDRRIASIALPALGCGQGGLEWSDVKPLIESALGDAGSHVIVYGPPSSQVPERGVTRRHSRQLKPW